MSYSSCHKCDEDIDDDDLFECSNIECKLKICLECKYVHQDDNIHLSKRCGDEFCLKYYCDNCNKDNVYGKCTSCVDDHDDFDDYCESCRYKCFYCNHIYCTFHKIDNRCEHCNLPTCYDCEKIVFNNRCDKCDTVECYVCVEKYTISTCYICEYEICNKCYNEFDDFYENDVCNDCKLLLYYCNIDGCKCTNDKYYTHPHSVTVTTLNKFQIYVYNTNLDQHLIPVLANIVTEYLM